MILKSLQAFSDANGKIYNEKATYYRQQLLEEIAYFEKQLERAKLVGIVLHIQQAQSAIEELRRKLDDINYANLSKMQMNHIDESVLVPLGEAVWQEAEAIKHKLQQDIQNAWQEAHEARDEFIEALRKIREIKDHSINVAREASSVCKPLRRNPFDPLRISNQNKFALSLDEINGLLGER